MMKFRGILSCIAGHQVDDAALEQLSKLKELAPKKSRWPHAPRLEQVGI